VLFEDKLTGEIIGEGGDSSATFYIGVHPTFPGANATTNLANATITFKGHVVVY
jgi:hypothetical protein